MDDSRALRLLRVEYLTDSSGTQKARIASDRQIFCRRRSVGLREAYAAMQIGRNPEIMADIPEAGDYRGENFAVVDGEVFKVLRTYQHGLKLELTLERTRDLEGMV